jgi:ATP-binding cassette subfamily B protein
LIKTLLGRVREYRKVSVLTPFLVFFETLMMSVLPYLMSMLIDQGLQVHNMTQVWRVGFYIIIATLFMGLFGVLGGWTAAKASAGFAKNLRHDLFYAIQGYSAKNIDKYSTSSLVVRLTTDVQRLQMAFQMSIRLAVRAPFSLIFSMCMAFYVDWHLALLFVYMIPIIALIMIITIKIAFPLFEKVFAQYDRLNTVVEENVDGIRAVKAYVNERREINKFKKESNTLCGQYTKVGKLAINIMPLMLLSIFSLDVLIMWLGAKQVVLGSLTTGELVSLVSYVSMAMMGLMMLSSFFVMMTISSASAKRVCDVLNEKVDLRDPEHPIMNVENGDIVFDHVAFSYSSSSDKLCLSDIDLNITSGERIGIIGGTGSSKTTLVSLIPRLYDTTEGHVLVGGVDVRNYSLKILRHNVAFVPQESRLFSGTIKENLRWGNETASDAQMERVCRIAQADAFIRTFPDGYDTHIEQGGRNVSGGQRQRLCIARALLTEPRIIIFDDSTSAVDMSTEASIRLALHDELPSVTQLIIAQRVSTVQECDRILVLDEGRISGFGTHAELLAGNAIYREVYESQTREVQLA